MKRISIFLFGVVSYAAFFISICYAMGFVAGAFVPKHIDSGSPSTLWEALIVNSFLLGAFAVQHTIMARPAFKDWFTQYVPKSMERSVFVLVASSILLVAYWQWRPLPDVVWQVTNPALAATLWAAYGLGWGLVLLSSFLINHFDLFGLRQVWLQLVNKAYSLTPFRLTGLYKYVRHPLMLGFLVAMWATPVMTQGHLLWSLLITGYIFVGIQFEERDLQRAHGEAYMRYKENVPMIIPYRGKGPVGLIEEAARRQAAAHS